MASPLQLIQTLLNGLGNTRKRSGPITLKPRTVGLPTASRLLSGMRQAPVETTDYDPNSVSLNLREAQPEPWNHTRARQIAPPDRLTKLQEEADYLAGGDDRGRGGSIIEQPGRLKSGLLVALSGIGEAARRNVESGRTDWSDLAGVAGAGVGGLGVGAVDPGLIVKARHKEAVDANAREINTELERANARSIIDSRKANDQYKASLEDKALRDQELRARDIARKQEYQNRSLQLRQDVLSNRISFEDWRKSQADLDREFDNTKFEETKRHNLVNEANASSNAESNRIRALKPPAGTGDPQDAYSRAEQLQAQIDELDAQDKREAAYKPVLDKTSKEPMVDAKGNIIYSNEFSDAYKQRQQQKKSLSDQKERLFTEARKAKGRSSTFATPRVRVSDDLIRQKGKAAGLTEAEIAEAIRRNNQ